MVDAGIAVNKLLLFADEDTNAMPTLRAAAEKRFDDRCSITTAVPGMLEFLPKGASKGAAVERLLKRLDIDPRNVLALGDGENDVEMLRLAGTAVAMAGSGAKVVAAAGGVVGPSNDDNGVAAAIEKYVLSTRGLPPASEMGKIRVEIDDDEANELLAAVGVDDVKDVERRLPSPKAAAMAIQSETIRKKLEKEAAKKKEDEKGEKEEEATTVAKEERSIVEAIAKEEEEPTRGPDLEMEEARRMNAELLEASKAAAARLAALRGTLKETEEELKRSEETQARKAERRAAKAEKARVRREEEEKKSEGEEEPSLADVAAAAKASANLSGWDDDAAAADSWEIAAESEQAAAVAAAASEAARRAEAAVGELEAAAEIVKPEVATMEEAGKRDATSSSSTSSSSSPRPPRPRPRRRPRPRLPLGVRSVPSSAPRSRL